ncbi:MAG: TonB-dependent receptor [Thermodesulfobacteriota bacterium]|nr:TonB-dependent receptor [Thermodesulfobacteriota bacterium]
MVTAFLIFLVFPCLALSDTGLAEESESTVILPPVIVSASRIPGTVWGSPADITLITRDEIEASNPSTAVDLLRQVPGLHVDQMGGRGGISSVYLRGSDPNFTLVLIDGIRVNDPTNPRGGSFDLSVLDVGNVERMEIVRGPLSSVHGSDAVAGVINIVTRHGTTEPEYSVQMTGGGKGYYSGSVEARGPCSTNGDYTLAAAYADNGELVEGDQFRGKNFSGKVTLFPDGAPELQCSLFYSDNDRESFPDDSGGPEYAVIREVDKRDSELLIAGLEMDFDRVSGLELTAKGSWYHHEKDASSPGVAPGVRDPSGIPPNTSDSSLDRADIELAGLFSMSERLWGSIGIDGQFEEGDEDTSLIKSGISVPSRFELERELYGSFIELRYGPAAGFTVEGGLRVDMPQDFDTEVSPKIGVMYKIMSSDTTLKANWGKGFKLPSFYSLGNAIVGNPDLVPETSEGFDFSVIQDLLDGRVRISMTPFYSRFFDIIDLEEGPPPRLVNRSEVTAKGIDWSLTARVSDSLWCNANVTYTETDVKDTDEELRNRPEWRGGVNVRWKARNDLVFNLDGLYVGEVLDSSIPTGDRTLDEYTRLDVSAVWSMTQKCELAVAIDNLFDADYEEAVGFPAPGIQARASVRLIF